MVLQWWVVPKLAMLHTEMPDAVPSLISLSSTDVVTRLEDARLDFGLVRAGEVPKGLDSSPLGEVEYALHVPRKLHKHISRSDVPALVAKLPLALQQSEPELNKQLFALAGKHERVEAALECETFPQACQAVRSGATRSGIVMGSPFLMRPDEGAADRPPTIMQRGCDRACRTHSSLRAATRRAAVMTPYFVSSSTCPKGDAWIVPSRPK